MKKKKAQKKKAQKKKIRINMDEKIDEMLDAILEGVLDEIKNEFKELFKEASADSLDFIKKSALQTAQWLMMKKNGELTEEEVKDLLEAQKKEALIFMNSQSIVARMRIQKLVCRLIDVAIHSLLAAI